MMKQIPLILISCMTLIASEPKQFVLVTSLYNEVNQNRQTEYLQSLQRLLENTHIKKIHVFYDTSKDQPAPSNILLFLRANPIDISYINNRPTFRLLFDFVNSQYAGEDIIICNGDIYFDDTLGLLNGFDLSNKFIALSKWDVLPNGQLESHPWYDFGVPERGWGSHDVWIFHSPITNFDTRGIALGTAYCDPYICYCAYAAHYQVFNPCFSITAHHLHCSGVRSWKLEPIIDHLLLVPWCTLDNIIYPTSDNVRIFNKRRKHKRH